MADASINREIVAVAIGLLEEESSRAHYSTLISVLYTPIDQGIAAALSVYDPAQAEAVVHGYFSEFLHLKVRSTTFLEGLVRSDYPRRYATTAAANFARDEIRKRPLLQITSATKTEDGDWGQVEIQQKDDTPTAAQALEAAEEQEGRQAWLEELAPDDQLLLGTLFVEANELPKHLMELLAKRRAVDVGDLQDELNVRSDDQAGKRQELQQELDGRAARIFSLQRVVGRVRAVTRQRGDFQAEPSELSNEQLKRLRGSQAALLEASAEERSGYEVHLEGRISHLVGLQSENRDRLQRDFPAGPKYEEVLSILGQLPKAAEDRKKAVNAINARFLRIRKRLKQRLAAELEEE